MAKVEKTITINAPVENIFSYISDPTNLPEFWPSLVEIKDVQPLPSEDTECVVNQRLVSKTKGGVESTQTWTFQPEAGGTKVTFAVEYTVPIPVLGKLAEGIIVKMNDREGDLILANLKARMEA